MVTVVVTADFAGSPMEDWSENNPNTDETRGMDSRLTAADLDESNQRRGYPTRQGESMRGSYFIINMPVKGKRCSRKSARSSRMAWGALQVEEVLRDCG